MGDNEAIVCQLQSGEGNRKALFEKLWTENISLIQIIISEFSGLNRKYDKAEFEELEQQAFIGIAEAVEKFDINRGIKFFSFAPYYIRLSISAYFYNAGQGLRIPLYMKSRIKEYTQERDRLIASGESAKSETIKNNLGWTDGKLKAVEKVILSRQIKSLDALADETDQNTDPLINTLESPERTEETVLTSVYLNELHKTISLAIKELPKEEQIIIRLYHYRGLSIRRIATILHCTPESVNIYRKTALKRMCKGKYAKELLSFMPEKVIERHKDKIEIRIKKAVETDLDSLITELSETERGLLL